MRLLGRESNGAGAGSGFSLVRLLPSGLRSNNLAHSNATARAGSWSGGPAYQAIHGSILMPSGSGTTGDPAAFVHPISIGKRRYMVAMFSLMAALISADQNLLAPHLTQVAGDFGFDDTQKDQYLGGYIPAAFFAVGAPAALVVGWLTDRTHRCRLLLGVVLVGAVPCLATFWVTEYWQLLVLRTLTGVSVGGSFPLVYSLLADLFPITARSGVSALVQVATGIGLAAGQAVSALTGGSNWRVPFVIVAAPSVVVAVIMIMTTQEPPRGGFEEALRGAYAHGDEYRETISWPKVRVLLRVPSNWLIILQGLPGSLPWGMMLTFFNDYLSQDQGFSIQIATLIVLLFGLGGAAGVIGGGALGQVLYNFHKEYMAVLMGVTVFLGIPPLLYLVNAPLNRLPVALTGFLSILGGFLASVAGPNLRAVLMNVNEPETRGVAFALQTMTDDLGKGLGPFIVAGFIQVMGRRGAFNLASIGWVPCGIMLGSLVCCMRHDEAAMQARLEAKVAAAQMTGLGAEDAGREDTPPDPDDRPPDTVLTPLVSPSTQGSTRDPAPHGKAALVSHGDGGSQGRLNGDNNTPTHKPRLASAPPGVDDIAGNALSTLPHSKPSHAAPRHAAANAAGVQPIAPAPQGVAIMPGGHMFIASEPVNDGTRHDAGDVGHA